MNQAFMHNDQPKRGKFSAPVLIYAGGHGYFLSKSGEISVLSPESAALFHEKDPVLVCHAPYTTARCHVQIDSPLDILELFAFTHPTRFCVPTPIGVIKAMGHVVPEDRDDILLSLLECTDHLLEDLVADIKNKNRILDLARAMGLQGRGWLWTPIIFAAFGMEYDYQSPIDARPSFNVWNHLSEWSDPPHESLETHFAITGDEARARLNAILDNRANAEQRTHQINYTTRLSDVFRPPEVAGSPIVTLAEAGTGVGKTLGYLAPSSVWIEKNNTPVWISTYTKNLQEQIDSELSKIYPDPDVKQSKVTIRKGRENYLCLLNFEDMALSSPLMQSAKPAIAAGILARWISATKDGDLSGSDFPGWLVNLLGHTYTSGLSDKRGECIYSACDHYHKCFAERVVRKSAQTPLVIANHATVMIQTAAGGDDTPLPHRYIFDEGHHLFHAADNVFCTHITGAEGYELRRWILGPEGGRKSRARGLKKRIDNVLPEQTAIQDSLYDVMRAAQKLPHDHWLKQLHDDAPHKPNFEKLIAAIQSQILARTDTLKTPYSIETSLFPLTDEVSNLLPLVASDLSTLSLALQKLSNYFRRILVDDMDKYSADQRKRIEILAQSIEKKIKHQLHPWIETIKSIQDSGVDPLLIDWIEIEKFENKIYDIGIYRHALNPMEPFARALKPNLHAAIITSATLRDQSGDEQDTQTWQNAFTLTGTNLLTDAPQYFSIPSPFSYKDQTKIIIVNDLKKDDIDELSSAYAHLFKAAGGSALGLFTSIQRLKSVYKKIEPTLSRDDITLYAQHIDGIDTGTLIDMFRDDVHSCLLGTDAVRDGVDVPGEALRLIAFDRVPWQRPTILHKARRQHFGKSAYDDQLTRLKLKQAFGRLIRKSDDHGVFLMLDGSMPSRLLSAFPEGCAVIRTGIKEAIELTTAFLNDKRNS